MENQATETRVLMHTNKGDIKLKLYNDTPLHRDNFIKLVKRLAVPPCDQGFHDTRR